MQPAELRTFVHKPIPMAYGVLYLIPTPLGEDGLHVLPDYWRPVLHRLDYLIAERAKTARRFIKSTGPERPIHVLHVEELNKRTPPGEIDRLLQPLRDGHDVGLMSEAGCPGVADPGSEVVARAHRLGIRVIPLVGPSSILLALMASGMNGQGFAFVGYLPAKQPALGKEILRLEAAARRHKSTQLFIETPYRNRTLIEQLLRTLQPATRLGIAADLTLPTEYIRTRTVAQWRETPPPDLHKRPAIFLIG